MVRVKVINQLTRGVMDKVIMTPAALLVATMAAMGAAVTAALEAVMLAVDTTGTAQVDTEVNKQSFLYNQSIKTSQS